MRYSLDYLLNVGFVSCASLFITRWPMWNGYCIIGPFHLALTLTIDKIMLVANKEFSNIPHLQIHCGGQRSSWSPR